ncbi:MAG: LysM peptidoglycan-binding domain-containing protein [Actinomycetia bacterium]|nr:LysM peptidoglycan-binding domain-containing protein [Actinomycetes bacterium]
MSFVSQPFTAAVRSLSRAALLALIGSALIIGPPLVLVSFVGNPLPTVIPSWDEISFAMTNGQIDSWTWIKGLALVAWLAWAQLGVSFVIELLAAIRGGKARAIRGLGATQWLAARIVTQGSIAASVLVQSSLVPASAVLPPLPVAAIVLEADGPASSAVIDNDPAHFAADEATEDHIRIMVGRRDTLWGLAEAHLGDGNRWEAIRDANAGRVMANGTILSEAFTRVEQGWDLLVPGVRSRLANPETEEVNHGGADSVDSSEVTISEGDNLWRLSERQLEPGGPNPSNAVVLDYVNEVVATNDQAIDDPDLIYPGQVFSFPDLAEQGSADAGSVPGGPGLGGGPTAGSAVDHSASQGGVGGQGDGSGPVPHSSTAVDDIELAHETSSAANEDQPEPLMLAEPYRTIGSVTLGAAGALLATGAAGLLRRRRRYRMAHRTPGTVPDPPLSELDPVQLALIRHGDEESVAWLQAAMASLGARPVWEGEEVAQPVIATLDGDHLDVEFSTPDTMAAPLPWVTPDDGHHWHLPRLVPIEDLPPGPGPGRGPVPTMVTIGVDTMINLEATGLLVVYGPAPSPMDLIRSLVHELATSSEAGTIDVRSTMAIAGTETYGLVQVQTPQAMVNELVPWLEDIGQRLDDGQSTNAYAHRLVNTPEPLGPVVIVTDETTLADLDPLTEYAHSRSLPLAMIVAGQTDGEFTIEVDAHRASIQPWDTTIEPQLLEEEVAEALGHLLADAESGKEQPLIVGVELSASVSDLRSRLDQAETALTTPTPAGPDHRQSGSQQGEDPALLASVSSPPVEAEPATPDEPVEVGKAITIRVLGHVDAVGAPELTSQQLSMLAFLACHGPSTKASLINGLWDGQVISQSRFPNLLAEVRARIGRNHLPEARDGRYELSGVSTDLAAFERGVRQAQRESDSEAMITLRSILELVRGIPFTPPGRRFWSWVGDHTHLAARVEALVADTAARLARLEQAGGSLDRAIWACEQGLMASPTDETLIILLTETYLAQGKRGLANRLVDSWEDKIGRLDCGEPSDEPRRRLVGHS